VSTSSLNSRGDCRDATAPTGLRCNRNRPRRRPRSRQWERVITLDVVTAYVDQHENTKRRASIEDEDEYDPAGALTLHKRLQSRQSLIPLLRNAL
jgi:hypothetical protein